MTQLEQLKQDLANLTERVNCAMALTDGSIYLTRDQLKDLIDTVQKQTLEYVGNELKYIDIAAEEYVELELMRYDHRIEIGFDNDGFMNEIIRSIDGPDVTDEDVDDLIKKYK